MTCDQVRERLSEHALGLLDPAEAAAIERHLEWCGGCRKESRELHEGLAVVAMGLPQATPPASLEDTIVARVSAAAGRRSTPASRRPARAVLVVALTAMVTTLLAVGWAVAERQRAGDAEARSLIFRNQVQDLRDLIDQFGGRQAALRPPAGGVLGSGYAVIIHLEDQPDMAIVEVLLQDPTEAPYTVRLQDDQGRTRLSFQLQPTNNGTLALLSKTDRDLRHVVRVQVLDGEDAEILSGLVEPLASGPT